ncbi:hypothetical protein [Novosphingobium sp.]|uniref:hypothetical protein n=1 Tax=Novosphingobium sp. TaxID=1874826 RepID=UPI0030180706
MFADATAMLEDAIAITVEGQRRDNSQDMQRAMACHLRMAITAMDGIVGEIKIRLGEADD